MRAVIKWLMKMETFNTPFEYFVSLHWKWFVFGLIVYFTVFGLTHWKNFIDWGG